MSVEASIIREKIEKEGVRWLEEMNRFHQMKRLKRFL
jgi:hypothetical protein